MKALSGIARAASAVSLVVTAGLFCLGGCAGDIGEVSFVQPSYIKKSDLLNKSWYYRRTVVDTHESNRGPDGEFGNWVTIGMGDLFVIERIKFEIQEDYLLGYRDYEFVPGSEELEYEGAADHYKGGPVVAFPITSHFTIQYDYDPLTGERTNVLRENTTDLQWHEHEYMRVEWNAVAFEHNPLMLPMSWVTPDCSWDNPMDCPVDTDGRPGSLEYVHENDATNPYHARLTPGEGFFDFTANHYVMPDIYTCYYDFDFSLYDITQCGAGEIKVRHAFMAVDEEENAGYDPLYYPDSVTLKDENGDEIRDPETDEVLREPIFERFGYYRLEKLTYDNVRDMTESGRLYRIVRFNIWERSVDQNRNTIPYADRTVRPIVYYLNWDFPSDLLSTAFEVAIEWNKAFKGAVASLQGKAVEDVPDVFILNVNSCNRTNLQNYLSDHSEVEELVQAEMGDADLPFAAVHPLENWCAATEYFSKNLEDPFTWEQMGDIRYNMLYWVPNIVPAAFSGYGPMLGDPMSGRNVVSAAYILGWTIDAAANRGLEYIDYINDEYSMFEYLRGENLPNFFFQGDYDPHAYTERNGRIGEVGARNLGSADAAELARRFRGNGETFQERMVPLDNSAYHDERLARIIGTELERRSLLREEDLIVASQGKWRPGMDVPDELWEGASVLGQHKWIRERRDRTKRFLEERTMCPLAQLDGALVGLAGRLKKLGLCPAEGEPDYDAACVDKSPEERHDMRLQFLRKEIFRAVSLHELGHNVGLRHNFESSYDALNYPREFWEMEAANGYGTAESEAAKENLSQPEFRYSSIMDYHGRTNADFRGLGLWDFAAIKFGYGQLVEVFADNSITGGKSLREWREVNDYRDLVFEDTDAYGPGPAWFDLSGTGATDLGARIDAMYDREDVVFDWTQESLKRDEVYDLLAREVPYLFCSDEFAGWTPTCKRFDYGANQREVQEAAKVKYKSYFIFSNFLRNRLVLDFDTATSRGFETFWDIKTTYQYFYLYGSMMGEDFYGTDLFNDMAQATANGLNLMNEVIAMPRPSTYYRCELDVGAAEPEITYYSEGYLRWDPVEDPYTGYGPDGETCDMSNQLGLGIGESYPLFLGLSDEDYNYTWTYVGVYWDKIYAVELMTYPAAWFPRVNMDEDSLRAYSVSLYRMYPREVNDILLGLIEFDSKSIASKVDTTTGAVVPRRVFTGTPSDVYGPEPEAKIVPALARNLQQYGLLYGMAFLTSPYDNVLDFAKHTKVVLKGAPDDFFTESQIPGVVECELPEAGLTYRAAPTSSPVTDDRMDIAFNFVNMCRNEVINRNAALEEYDDIQAVLEALDEESPEYLLTLQEQRDAARRYWIADDRLRETEQVLVWMREYHRFYEHGIGY